MTAINFCYWLQGWRELHGADAPTSEQAECIQRHLDLVAISIDDSISRRFCRDLQGAFVFGCIDWPKVWKELSYCFQHEIDKIDERPQEALNEIHNGGPGGPVYRC